MGRQHDSQPTHSRVSKRPKANCFLSMGNVRAFSPLPRPVANCSTSGHSTPTQYTGAIYTPLTTGNKSNGTHWQFTVKCSGCTSYTGASGAVRIDPLSSKRLGYACSPNKVSTPSSPTSTIPVHDVYNYFTHDFSAGANPNFATLLNRNGVSGGDTGNVTEVS